MSETKDIFDGAETVPGLEKLGRAIVDERGEPSGSPANYEKTRGMDGLKPVNVAKTVSKLKNDPGLQVPEEEDEELEVNPEEPLEFN